MCAVLHRRICPDRKKQRRSQCARCSRMGHSGRALFEFQTQYAILVSAQHTKYILTPPNSKENPDSQKSSLIKLLILKKCSFASSFVSLLIDTYPAAAAHRSGRTCRLHWVLGTSKSKPKSKPKSMFKKRPSTRYFFP